VYQHLSYQLKPTRSRGSNPTSSMMKKLINTVTVTVSQSELESIILVERTVGRTVVKTVETTVVKTALITVVKTVERTVVKTVVKTVETTVVKTVLITVVKTVVSTVVRTVEKTEEEIDPEVKDVNTALEQTNVKTVTSTVLREMKRKIPQSILSTKKRMMVSKLLNLNVSLNLRLKRNPGEMISKEKIEIRTVYPTLLTKLEFNTFLRKVLENF
jgi:hypothetical protein